jgi:coatomer protein complex subunit gamma
MLKVGVSNFRNAWESMDPESERVDEYGLGVRESLAEAVSAVISILGMQPCEVSLLHLSFSYGMNAMVI